MGLKLATGLAWTAAKVRWLDGPGASAYQSPERRTTTTLEVDDEILDKEEAAAVGGDRTSRRLDKYSAEQKKVCSVVIETGNERIWCPLVCSAS